MTNPDVPVQLAVGCEVYDLGAVTSEPQHRLDALAALLHDAADLLTTEEIPCPDVG